MNSGPVEQLRPSENRSACISDAASASAVWPASIVPVSSIVRGDHDGHAEAELIEQRARCR